VEIRINRVSVLRKHGSRVCSRNPEKGVPEPRSPESCEVPYGGAQSIGVRLQPGKAEAKFLRAEAITPEWLACRWRFDKDLPEYSSCTPSAGFMFIAAAFQGVVKNSRERSQKRASIPLAARAPRQVCSGGRFRVLMHGRSDNQVSQGAKRKTFDVPTEEMDLHGSATPGQGWIAPQVHTPAKSLAPPQEYCPRPLRGSLRVLPGSPRSWSPLPRASRVVNSPAQVPGYPA
jgi:hypothetical protein